MSQSIRARKIQTILAHLSRKTGRNVSPNPAEVIQPEETVEPESPNPRERPRETAGTTENRLFRVRTFAEDTVRENAWIPNLVVLDEEPEAWCKPELVLRRFPDAELWCGSQPEWDKPVARVLDLSSDFQGFRIPSKELLVYRPEWRLQDATTLAGSCFKDDWQREIHLCSDWEKPISPPFSVHSDSPKQAKGFRLLESPEKPSRLDPNRVYLITGGTSRFGFDLADRLAELGARKLVLLGIHPFPPRDFWQQLVASGSGESFEKVSRILEMEHSGVLLKTYFGPLHEKERLDLFLRQVRAGMGKIAGVFHIAANLREDEEKVGEPLQVLAPRIDGLKTLLPLLDDPHPDFWISLVLENGNPGRSAARLFLEAGHLAIGDNLPTHVLSAGPPVDASDTKLPDSAASAVQKALIELIDAPPGRYRAVYHGI